MKKAPKQTQYKILSIDPWLQPYYSDIALRMERHANTRKALLGDMADLSSFANGYLYYGINRTETGWVYREWAPGADALHLIGDFNDWNRESHPLTRLPGRRVGDRAGGRGRPEARPADQDPGDQGRQDLRPHPRLHPPRGAGPPDQPVQRPDLGPARPFQWTDGGYGKRKVAPLFIYEAHIGMAQEKEGVGTYREFADFNLEYIHDLGYNTVQLMAIQEHAYYASFGYQVTNFFAASSWYGEPEDLKYLINKAHELGMYVLLDVVHSHASANATDGLNMLDGTDYQYFHHGSGAGIPPGAPACSTTASTRCCTSCCPT